MSTKNIIYLFEVGVSVEDIAKRYNMTVEAVKAVLSTPPTYRPTYVSRQRGVNVKGVWA